MKRIGILGGTFNPIHVGHLMMAQVSWEQVRLDKVIFVPSFIPPHKKILNLASAPHRIKMVRAGISDNACFEVSDFEIQKQGKSYTVDTVKYFRDISPKGAKLFFIIGGDSFPTLNRWKDIDVILKTVSFIVVNRPGYRTDSRRIKHLSVVMPGIDISSSFLRQRIKQGKSIKYLTVDPVVDYIDQHKLYTASTGEGLSHK